MEVLKILKFQTPKPLYSSYVISHRKTNTIIQKFPSNDFIYRSSVLWNKLFKLIKIEDFSQKLAPSRTLLKKLLFSLQHQENPTDWTTEDFNISKIKSLTCM